MLKNIKFLFLLLLALTACKPRDNELKTPGYELEGDNIEISKEVIDDIIRNISSPIEMAALLKDLGVPFDNSNLSEPGSSDNYSTNFKMAYTLGMLGADLGYLNVYEKTRISVSYLSAINRLADGLKVNQFFDYKTIKHLATSESNQDSLVFLSVHSFNQINDYFRATDRNNLSAMMISGIWIEGMYQITSAIQKNRNPELAEYIGEQKLILNNLLLILKNYEGDDQFAILIEDYNQLKDAFQKVHITYEVGEPEIMEEDGMLIVIQNEKSTVDISEDTLNEIIEKTAIIRNKHSIM